MIPRYRSEIFNSLDRTFKAKSVQLFLSGPHMIKKWAQETSDFGFLPLQEYRSGQVLTFLTYDYKSFQPYQSGLFCETLFGPVDEPSRRRKLAYFQLPCPLMHIWYLKGTISHISRLINRKRKFVQRMVYNRYFTCTRGDGFYPEEINSKNIRGLVPSRSRSSEFDLKSLAFFKVEHQTHVQYYFNPYEIRHGEISSLNSLFWQTRLDVNNSLMAGLSIFQYWVQQHRFDLENNMRKKGGQQKPSKTWPRFKKMAWLHSQLDSVCQANLTSAPVPIQPYTLSPAVQPFSSQKHKTRHPENENQMNKQVRHPFIRVIPDMLTFFVHPTDTPATLNQSQKIPENLLGLFWTQPAVQKHLKSGFYGNPDLGQIYPQFKPNLDSPFQMEHLSTLNEREIPLTPYTLFKNTLNRHVHYVYQPRIDLYQKKYFDVKMKKHIRANHVDNVLGLFYEAMGQRSRQARRLSQQIHMQAKPQPTNRVNLKRQKQVIYDDFIFGFEGLSRDLQYRVTTRSRIKEIRYGPYRNNIIVDTFKLNLGDANYLYPSRLNLAYDHKQSLFKRWQSYLLQFRYLRMLWKPTWEQKQGIYDSPKNDFKRPYYEWPLTLNHLYDLSENFDLYPKMKKMKQGLCGFEQNSYVNPHKVLDLVRGFNLDLQLGSKVNPSFPVNPLHVGLPSHLLSKPKRALADPLSCSQVRRSLQVKFQTCLQKSVWLCLLKQTGKAMAEQQLRLKLQAFIPQAEPAKEIQAWLNYEKTKIIYFFVQRFHPNCSLAPFGLASAVSKKKPVNPSGSVLHQRQDQNHSLLTRFRWWSILEKKQMTFLSSKMPLTYSSLLKWGLQMYRPLMFHPFVFSNIKMEVMIHKLVSEWVLVRHAKEAWTMNPLNTYSFRSKPVETNAFSKRRDLFLAKQRLYLTPRRHKPLASPNKALFKAQIFTWFHVSSPWLWLKIKHERWRLSLWWRTCHKSLVAWKYLEPSCVSLSGWFTFSDILLYPKLDFDLTYQDVYIDRHVPFEGCDSTFTYPQRQTPTQVDTLRNEMFLDFYFPFFQRQPRFIRNKFCVWPQLFIYETEPRSSYFDFLMLVVGHKVEDRVLGPYVDRGFSFETDTTGSRPLSLYLGQLRDPTFVYDSQSVSPARGGPYLRYTSEMKAQVQFLNRRILKRKLNRGAGVEANFKKQPAISHWELSEVEKRGKRRKIAVEPLKGFKKRSKNRKQRRKQDAEPINKNVALAIKIHSQALKIRDYRTLQGWKRWLDTNMTPIYYQYPRTMFCWDWCINSCYNRLKRSIAGMKELNTMDEKDEEGLRRFLGNRIQTKNLDINRKKRIREFAKKMPGHLASKIYRVENRHGKTTRDLGKYLQDVLKKHRPLKNAFAIRDQLRFPAKNKAAWKTETFHYGRLKPYIEKLFGSETEAILYKFRRRGGQPDHFYHRKFSNFVFFLLGKSLSSRMGRRWTKKRRIHKRKGTRTSKLVYLARRKKRRNSKDMRVRLILFRKLRLMGPFSQGNIEPNWMLIERVPILPPDLRPIMLLQGQKPITSDLNKLYINVIRRGLELRHLFLLEEIDNGGDEPYYAHAYDVNPFDPISPKYMEYPPLADIHDVPDAEADDYLWYFNSRGLNYPHYTRRVHHQGDPNLRFKHTLLQNAVDSLIQNGKGAPPEVVSSSNPRALKSLSDILKGKKGRFRQNLLGKRVDYSGRSVIVVGPELQLHQCGLPREMALILFQPFVIRALLKNQLARDFYHAKRLIRWHQPVVYKTLQTILDQRPILLNRAPTLHRLGIQAFKAKLVAGRAILLHPLVCSAFNADFDGDQMAVHIPLSRKACAEAWTLMWSRNHLLSIATNEPVPVPSQDMVLGCYYLTSWDPIRRFDLLNQTLIQDPVLGSLTTSSPKTSLGLAIQSVNLENQTESAGHFLPHAYHRVEEKQLDSKTWRQLDPIQSLYHHGQIQHHTIFWLQCKTFETQCRNQPTWEFQMDSFGRCMHYHSDFKTFSVGHSETHYIKTTLGRALMNRNLKDILHP
jgi:DNA-directed RNA polymerase beta' subunit